MKIKTQNIDIVLSNRIGDSILSLPALICLKQMIEKSNPLNYKVRIVSTNLMTELYKKFNIFEFIQMNLLNKAMTWINSPDKVLFLQASGKTKYYKGKVTYGKNFLKDRYDQNLVYLKTDSQELDPELYEFLTSICNFSPAVARYFGICNTFGYSSEDIISAFKFNIESFNLMEAYSNKLAPADRYVVFCLEAGNNKEHCKRRRWKESNYFDIAEYLYSKHNISSVFIGKSNNPEIPQNSYFFDLRNKLNILELSDIIKNSLGYIGNDTGLLHLANLMKRKSISVYAEEPTAIYYAPIFSDKNMAFIQPQNIDKVIESIDNNFFF